MLRMKRQAPTSMKPILSWMMTIMISHISKNQNEDGTLTNDVETEHIHKRLNDPTMTSSTLQRQVHQFKYYSNIDGTGLQRVRLSFQRM